MADTRKPFRKTGVPYRRRRSGQALIEGAAATILIVGLVVGGILLIIFAGASMLYVQKINFAAQSGAAYAAEIVGPASYFLGAPRANASSPQSVMSANAGTIQTAVQQTLSVLGVPGGSLASVTPSVTTQGGVQMAQVTVSLASFRIPGMPANVPPLQIMPVTAAVPFTQPLDKPPVLLELLSYGSQAWQAYAVPCYAVGTTGSAFAPSLAGGWDSNISPASLPSGGVPIYYYTSQEPINWIEDYPPDGTASTIAGVAPWPVIPQGIPGTCFNIGGQNMHSSFVYCSQMGSL